MVRSDAERRHREFAPMSDFEIGVYWRWADRFPQPIDSFFKLLLITGYRPGEVSDADWNDLDLENGYWLLRSRKYHRVVHISPWAISILPHTHPHSSGRIFSPFPTEDDRMVMRARKLISSWQKKSTFERRLALPDIRWNVMFRLRSLGVDNGLVDIALGRTPISSKLQSIYLPGATEQHTLLVWENDLRRILAEPGGGDQL